MESRTQLVARLEREIAEHEELALRERVQAQGKRLQLEQLRTGLVQPTALAELTLSAAVVEVLKKAPAPLGPSAIHEELSAGGREDPLRSIGGILQSLKRRGTVEQVARGLWAAIR